MTRINSGIPVKNLTDEHLLAEHREIKRMPYYVKRILKGEIKKPDIPPSICLGKGHVKFFVDKGEFTLNRYLEIKRECENRNYTITDFSSNWKDLPQDYMKTYEPSEVDRVLLMDRIEERIFGSKLASFHYRGQVISKEEAIGLLRKKVV